MLHHADIFAQQLARTDSLDINPLPGHFKVGGDREKQVEPDIREIWLGGL